MAGPLVIPKSRAVELGLDQPRLYALGLDRVRELAGEVWTDHNVHDPGITMLELASYALTDLTYRTSLPIEDLLSGSGLFEPVTAARILPNQPLTPLDYRKLMIDVDGVQNAWIAPRPLPCFLDTATGEIRLNRPNRPGIRDVTIRGLYEARIAYIDDTLSNVKKKRIRNEVEARLHAHRNLCEDFVGVMDVERQAFLLCGELDLTASADVGAVHREILTRVQAYLAPGVRRYTRDEMLARRRRDGDMRTPADAFEGPLLTGGFIDDDELAAADLRTEVRLSDIISIVMDIPGVQAVRQMLVGPEPQGGVATPIENRWVVPVEAGKQPGLNPARCRLVYCKGPIALIPPKMDALPAADAKKATCDDVPIPAGRARQVDQFGSFQRDFPAVYGVGDSVLPGSAPVRRRALAAQLKAFLLFFDQVMANFCAQLAHVAALFAIERADTPTYYAQLVDRSTGYLAVYGLEQEEHESEEDFARRVGRLDDKVRQGVEARPARVTRRTRFLDHLIARFAERFHDYAQIMRSAFGATDASLLEDRRAFLEAYPSIGRDRGLAYDYTRQEPAAIWDTRDNVSGLERRVARLLGIGDDRRRDLTTVTPGADVQVSGAANQFGYALTDRDAAAPKTLLREDVKSATEAEARAQMLRALELGQWASTYVSNTKDEKWFFTIVAQNGEVVGRSEGFGTEAEMAEAVVELRSYLRRHYSREGLYVIENLLLRPEKAADASLHACVDPSCTACGDDDPYSFRIHVILPAYAGRFNDIGFRRFAEETIRREVPAHVLPKICWIDEASMEAVQKAYRDWLEARAGQGTAAERAARLAAIVKTLTEVKSVYPVQKLVPCDAPEAAGRFVLGRTALGTKADND